MSVAAYYFRRGGSSPSDSTGVPLDSGPAATEVASVNPGYLGPKVCAECHARRVEEFSHTGHYRACRIASEQEMPAAAFSPEKNTLVTEVDDLRYEMKQAGKEFLVTTIRSTAAGEKRTTNSIDLLLGDGTIDDGCLSWEGDRMYELPVTWIHTRQQWGTSQFDLFGDEHSGREMTPRCLECHNTWFDYIPGSRNQYKRDSFILGVTCERCHGPGREHVEWHREHPQVKEAHAIVHPGQLPRERQIEVCTQCHSNAIKYRRPPLSYRPGLKLDDFYRTLTIEHSEDDHVANQIQRLRQSQCFLNSETMTCVTCHNPHQKPEPHDPAAQHDSCIACHKRDDCGEHEKLPVAVRDQCVDCHMPQYVKINVNFSTSDELFVPPTRRYEHRIAIHEPAMQTVLLNWYRQQPDAESRSKADELMTSLVEHWREEAGKCRSEYRFLEATARLREALLLSPPPEVRESLSKELRETALIDANLTRDWLLANHQIAQNQLPKAIEMLESLLKIKPDFSRAHARLGTLYARTGKMQQALEHLNAVAKCDPNDSAGYSMLGWLAYLQNDAEEAVKQFRRADELDPFDPTINYHWALALLKLQRWDEAVTRFQQVLEIDPNHVGGNQGLAQALRMTGKPQEAVAYAERAAEQSHNQIADVLETLADTYAAVGRTDDALEAIARAISAAERNSPQRVDHLLQRRSQMQLRQDAKRKSNF